MIITNTEKVDGYTIKANHGLVKGVVVVTTNMFFDKKGLKGMKESVLLENLTQTQEKFREMSVEKMKEEATKLGANAVVNVRLSSAGICDGACEITTYGTAVVIEKDHE